MKRSALYSCITPANPSAAICPSHALTPSSPSSTGLFYLYSTRRSAVFASGASVAWKIDTVFCILSSTIVTVVSDTSITLNGPVFIYNKLMYDLGTRRSAAEILIGGRSRYKNFPVVKNCGTWLTFRLRSFLYRPAMISISNQRHFA